ncbi:hypothetical protein EV126DRAFT_31052 [Verticillium dahliae]|nr:hypothetical protein EV126DRAFT_31052 [Verticillium dahliae]
MPALSGMRRAIELNIAVRHGQAWLLWPLSGLGILIFSLSLGRCNGVLGACTALPIMHVKRQVGGWWRKHGCGPQYPVGTVRLFRKIIVMCWVAQCIVLESLARKSSSALACRMLHVAVNCRIVSATQVALLDWNLRLAWTEQIERHEEQHALHLDGRGTGGGRLQS